VKAVVLEAPAGVGVDGLEAALLEAFRALRDAVAADRPAVVVLRERDVLAHGDEFDAALAHGLIGLVRAFATEGSRPGWRVNALSVPDDLDEDARSTWLERLSEPAGASGVVVRLGEVHLGKVGA
jgi:hypothetical protein